MVLRPPCIVLSTIGISYPGKLEGQSTKQCSTSSTACLITYITTEDRLLYRMSLDFSPLLKQIPFMQHVWRHFAEQDRILNGTNIWNLPVSYNKLCFEAVDSGAKELPFRK